MRASGQWSPRCGYIMFMFILRNTRHTQTSVSFPLCTFPSFQSLNLDWMRFALSSNLYTTLAWSPFAPIGRFPISLYPFLLPSCLIASGALPDLLSKAYATFLDALLTLVPSIIPQLTI